VRKQGKLRLGAGRVVDRQGRVLATARGKFLPLDDRQVQRFVGDED
jgi:hypothetical protein